MIVSHFIFCYLEEQNWEWKFIEYYGKIKRIHDF
jgi:hypothetical protein